MESCLRNAILLTVLCGVPSLAHPGKTIVKIGALYSSVDQLDSHSYYDVMAHAVTYVNNRSDVLPDVHLELIRANSTLHDLDRFSSLSTACQLIGRGAVALIGPGASTSVKAAHPVCQGLGYPHIAPQATDPYLTGPEYEFLFKMLPPDTYQSLALVGLMRHFGWTTMALLVSNTDYGRHGLETFTRVALDSNWDLTKSEVFEPREDVSLIDARPQLESIKGSGARVVILNAPYELALPVLVQARDMDMFLKGWSWVVTDGVTNGGEDVGPLNIGGRSVGIKDFPGIIGPYPSATPSQILRDIENFAGTTFGPSGMSVIDSVLAVAYGLDKFLADGHVFVPREDTVCTCSGQKSDQAWQQGRQFANAIRETQIPGARTFINFTSENYVWERDYDIMNLVAGKWEKVGKWDYEENQVMMENDVITFPGMTREIPSASSVDIRGRNFSVVTILESPFVMLDPGYPEKSSKQLNDMSIQLLEKLAKVLDFTYTVQLVPDGKYGNRDKNNNRWNGLIGEIVTGKSELVVAPLTITSERQDFVDFTAPYWDTGYDVLTRKMRHGGYLFDFFNPFDVYTWVAVLASTYLCGLAVCGCSFLSPCGYRGRYTQRQDRADQAWAKKRNTFNIMDSVWFAVSSFLIQGPTDNPISLSGRLVAATWWGITTILLAAYTANLTAHLTVERLESGISSVYDLVRRTDLYTYGTVADSAVQEFFSQVSLDPLPAMYKYMNTMGTYVSNASEGIARVRGGANSDDDSLQYALIFDASALEYAARQEPCDTQLTNKLFRHQGYGLALPKNSPYTAILTSAILGIRERGELEAMYEVWMAGPCSLDDVTKVKGRQISFDSLAGIFLLFAGAIMMAMFIILFEYCVTAYKDLVSDRRKQRDNTTMWYHLRRRLAATRADIWDTICSCRKKEYGFDEHDQDTTSNSVPESDHDFTRKTHTKRRLNRHPRTASLKRVHGRSIRKVRKSKRSAKCDDTGGNSFPGPGGETKSNPAYNMEEYLYMFRKSVVNVKFGRPVFGIGDSSPTTSSEEQKFGC